MNALKRTLILFLLSSIGFSIGQLKIVLESGEVIQNCQFENIRGDRLYISDISKNTPKKNILIDHIRLITIKTDLAVNKYDFAYIAREDKTEILNEIFTIMKSTNKVSTHDMTTDKVNKYTIIGIAIVISIVLMLIINKVLVKRRKNDD